MTSMFVLENVPLSEHSTMRLGGQASYFTEVSSRDDIKQAVQWAFERKLPVKVIGDGSNIVWDDDGYPGLVIANKISGIEVTGDFGDSAYVTAGGGVNWDEFVAQTVTMGLTGIEFLSLIPGTVGATPVQNVGAYGSEVKDTIATLEVFDIASQSFTTLRNSDCAFGYRTSRFKTADAGRYIITSVTFALQKGLPKPPFYAALQNYLDTHQIKEVTPLVIRDAVIAIRSSKLPDPATVANNGSFFANPIIDQATFTQLYDTYPMMPHWEVGERIKLSAAWLLEQSGFKDYHDAETGMATWHAQPLVLVNESAKSTAQLKQFKQKLVSAVQQKFGITLEQEPELV